MAKASKPVIVAGAGPVGLATAVELHRHGVPVRILDRNEARSAHSKAIAINPRSLDLLEAAGLTERFLAEGRRILRVHFHDRRRRLVGVEMRHMGHRFPFALSLPQSDTERVLEAALAERGIAVERRTEVTALGQDAERARVVLVRDGRQETAETPWLVGADGAHSTVRKALGLGFPGETEEERWRIVDARIEGELDDEAVTIVYGQPGHLFFAIALPGERMFRIAASGGSDPAELVPDSRIVETLWSSDFRISYRLVERYGRGRCMLAGDAAHLHSPAGGRGMNLGIEDACELARRIAEGGAEAYPETRHARGEQVARETRMMTRMATTADPLQIFLRNRVMPLALSLPSVQRRFLRRMMGLG